MTMPPRSIVHDRRVERTPAIDGQIDLAYLSGALARAGRPVPATHLAFERLDGGRISRGVYALRSDAGAFVLKRCATERWRAELFGMTYNEPALWLCGVTRALPVPLACPTIDVAFDANHGECWMLMDDVAHGIAPRGGFDEALCRRLLEAIARLHARYWARDAELAALPLLSLEQHTRMFTDPCAAIGGRLEAKGWIGQVLDTVTLFRTYVPMLLDVLGPADADFYLDLCQRPQRWLGPLDRAPKTLVHGDLRRANIALLGSSSVTLFDWDFASRAPAAADIAWYAFLHFWCYPPRDGRTPMEREPLLLHYRQRLAAELGHRFDEPAFERAWQLSWLKAFAQLAFCLVDPLVGSADREEVARARAVCRAAVSRAKQILDTHGD
jgi:hypothetical protein